MEGSEEPVREFSFRCPYVFPSIGDVEFSIDYTKQVVLIRCNRMNEDGKNCDIPDHRRLCDYLSVNWSCLIKHQF